MLNKYYSKNPLFCPPFKSCLRCFKSAFPKCAPQYYSQVSSREVHIHSHIHSDEKECMDCELPWGVDKGVHCSKQIYGHRGKKMYRRLFNGKIKLSLSIHSLQSYSETDRNFFVISLLSVDFEKAVREGKNLFDDKENKKEYFDTIIFHLGESR